MHAHDFDEGEFFRVIAGSGARALLIGRRALIALGLPLLTADYDFWLHAEDAARLNDCLDDPLGFVPSRTPEQARTVGRYVLENEEKVDVLLARTMPTIVGTRIAFDDVWKRRRHIEIAPGVDAALPTLDDLIATKRFGSRPRDADDVRLLETLRERDRP